MFVTQVASGRDRSPIYTVEGAGGRGYIVWPALAYYARIVPMENIGPGYFDHVVIDGPSHAALREDLDDAVRRYCRQEYEARPDFVGPPSTHCMNIYMRRDT